MGRELQSKKKVEEQKVKINSKETTANSKNDWLQGTQSNVGFSAAAVAAGFFGYN